MGVIPSVGGVCSLVSISLHSIVNVQRDKGCSSSLCFKQHCVTGQNENMRIQLMNQDFVVVFSKMGISWPLTFDLVPVVSPQPTSEERREEEKEGDANTSAEAMNRAKVSSRGEVFWYTRGWNFFILANTTLPLLPFPLFDPDSVSLLSLLHVRQSWVWVAVFSGWMGRGEGQCLILSEDVNSWKTWVAQILKLLFTLWNHLFSK